jgi:hypothetical protein
MNTKLRTYEPVKIDPDQPENLRQSLEKFNAALKEWNDIVERGSNIPAPTPEPGTHKIVTAWLVWGAIVGLLILALVAFGG